MVTKTLPELDLELSRSGTNAYYCDFCPHTGNRPNYAACLKRIHNVQEGNYRNYWICHYSYSYRVFLHWRS